ncbi:MAG: RyR domain-containing protein [Candidatus Freyarchaeum deiterrae]
MLLCFSTFKWQSCPVESNGEKQKPFKFTKDEVELLAKMEHSRWTADHFLKGWTYGKRSAELRTSPYLVEWERLTDDIKESYRRGVRDIPDLLTIINLEIQRNSQTG